MEKVVAIMQPTFLPWLGYFNLLSQADVFVFLDTVQFERRSWQQRNRIKTVLGEKIISVPVKKSGLRDQKIMDVKFADNWPHQRKKMVETLRINLMKTSFFSQYFDSFVEHLQKDVETLADLNISLVQWGCDELSIGTRMLKASDLGVPGKKERLLNNICLALSATTYLSPEGSKVYLGPGEIFEENGIKIIFQRYPHPIYKQVFGDFISHLAFVDGLFNLGSTKLRSLIDCRL